MEYFLKLLFWHYSDIFFKDIILHDRCNVTILKLHYEFNLFFNLIHTFQYVKFLLNSIGTWKIKNSTMLTLNMTSYFKFNNFILIFYFDSPNNPPKYVFSSNSMGQFVNWKCQLMLTRMTTLSIYILIKGTSFFSIVKLFGHSQMLDPPLIIKLHC